MNCEGRFTASSGRVDSGFETLGSMSTPPDGLPVYRVLTGPDDAAFCRRVSEALALGYRLHEGPAVTFDGDRVVVAQAVVWPTEP
ncbi:hypothetical protein GCM10010271_26390 [Streptomyces kurssanovii]|nr:hypothetical protein GCM10010271_26390 [Streptomyces kurssanovii]